MGSEDKMQSIFKNGYPCEKCIRKDECGAEHGCLEWRDWFKFTWKKVRGLYGKFNSVCRVSA